MTSQAQRETSTTATPLNSYGDPQIRCNDCGRQYTDHGSSSYGNLCPKCEQKHEQQVEGEYQRWLSEQERLAAAAHAHDTYTVAAETGSCCGPHDSRSPAPDGGCHWEEQQTCGHAHRTYAAAERCQERLIGYNTKTRSCSALWYNSRIHNQHGQRA
jgi:hypothetical protein